MDNENLSFEKEKMLKQHYEILKASLSRATNKRELSIIKDEMHEIRTEIGMLQAKIKKGYSLIDIR